MPRRPRFRPPEPHWPPIPPRTAWTHVLSWDGTIWTLQQAGSATAVSLGDRLTAAILKQNLPAGAKLWVKPSAVARTGREDQAGERERRSARGEPGRRELRANRGPDRGWARIRVVPQERAGGRAAFAQCAAAQPRLLGDLALPCADRLGARGQRRRPRSRQRQTEQLLVAARQGARMARTGQQPRRCLRRRVTTRWP